MVNVVKNEFLPLFPLFKAAQGHNVHHLFSLKAFSFSHSIGSYELYTLNNVKESSRSNFNTHLWWKNMYNWLTLLSCSILISRLNRSNASYSIFLLKSCMYVTAGVKAPIYLKWNQRTNCRDIVGMFVYCCNGISNFFLSLNKERNRALLRALRILLSFSFIHISDLR